VKEEKNMEEIKLPELAKIEAQFFLDQFKKKLLGICEDVIGDLYVNIMPYIESDSWNNFRNQVVSELQGYGKSKLVSRYEIELIRRSLLDNYRDEIIKDLNQDMLEEIKSLKKEIERLRGTFGITLEETRIWG
jgi:hypothetical protein